MWNVPLEAVQSFLPVPVLGYNLSLLGREMAHLALPIHAALCVISTTSSAAAKQAGRSLLSSSRWIAAGDFISSLMNMHSVALQFKLVLCGSCLSNAPMTSVLADLEYHQGCLTLDVTQRWCSLVPLLWSFKCKLKMKGSSWGSCGKQSVSLCSLMVLWF